MKRITHLLLALAFLGAAAFALVPANALAADAKAEICKGVNAVGGGSGCSSGAGEINKVINNGINAFSVIVGVVAVVMIVVGGLKYITSGGDSSKITGAKHTIVYALIGLVVVALAQTIVKFVLGKVT